MMQKNSMNQFFNKGERCQDKIPITKAYYYQNWHGFSMDEHHSHDYVEIMYVLTNQCLIEVDAESYNLKKGEFIFIEAKVPHRLSVAKDCLMLNIEFGFQNSKNSALDFGKMIEESHELQAMLDAPFRYKILKDTEDMSVTLIRLIREHELYENENNLLKTTLYHQLFVQIARMIYQKKEEMNYSGIGYIKKAKEYLHANYDQSLKISEVAEALSIHENYLQKLFKAYTDETITDYLNGYRMKKAAMMLLGTEMAIIEICQYVGISSRQYFTKLFKKYYNMTPTSYRMTQKMSE